MCNVLNLSSMTFILMRPPRPNDDDDGDGDVSVRWKAEIL